MAPQHALLLQGMMGGECTFTMPPSSGEPVPSRFVATAVAASPSHRHDECAGRQRKLGDFVAEIPYDRLQIPDHIQAKFRAGPTKGERLALARAVIPMDDQALLGVCYLLLGDDTPKIASSARKTLLTIPVERVLAAIDRVDHHHLLRSPGQLQG